MKKWYQLGLFNLSILAFLGLMLRYKMVFSLPFINYTYLLHAHSHFAFSGWISFMLQLLILQEFTEDYKNGKRFWNRFLVASTVVNYAMIISFAATGYGAISIAISTSGIFLSYIFCYKIYKKIQVDSNNRISIASAKSAMLFLLLSSLGPYALGISMATKASANLQHNALYFFLYFQYAGWFTFAVLSFLFKKLETCQRFNRKTASTIFNLFLFTCVPAYLSVCAFEERSAFITGVLIATSVIQSIALYLIIRLLLVNKKDFFSNSNSMAKRLTVIAISSFVLKCLLQLLSIHPALEQISLSNRAVMIAYLHLVFLCFVSIYLLTILIEKGIISVNKTCGLVGTLCFVAGVIINEMFLAFQGVSGLLGFYPRTMPMLLFINTILMAAGAFLVFVAAVRPIQVRIHSLDIKLKLPKVYN